MIKPLFLTAALGTAAMLAIGPAAAQQDLSRPGSAFVPQDNPGNWPSTVVRTERGHLIGNPEAETRLIEFISYTCPHCADFAAQGEPALELAVLMPGKATLEIRSIIRNPLDLTVTLLAQCGDPAGFKARHQTLMRAQPDWLAKARGAPQSQQAIWMRGDKAGRMNAASALGLTDMLVRRGQSQAELDACVMDDAAAKQVVANDRADRAEFAVPGTPSFALDGKLLAEVHSWDALYAVLSARFTEAPAETATAPG
jgi:protein-disulfide isomerase